MTTLAGAFDYIQQIFRINSRSAFRLPYNRHLQHYGLNDPWRMKEYILSLQEDCSSHFPYQVAVHRSDSTMDDEAEVHEMNYDFGELTIDGGSYHGDEDDEMESVVRRRTRCGRQVKYDTYTDSRSIYSEQERDCGNDFVLLRGLKGSEFEYFHRWYRDRVPGAYQDDIAVIIQGLRDEYWYHQGCGGISKRLANGLRGAAIFSRQNHNNYNTTVMFRQSADYSYDQTCYGKQDHGRELALLEGQEAQRQLSILHAEQRRLATLRKEKSRVPAIRRRDMAQRELSLLQDEQERLSDLREETRRLAGLQGNKTRLAEQHGKQSQPHGHREEQDQPGGLQREQAWQAGPQEWRVIQLQQIRTNLITRHMEALRRSQVCFPDRTAQAVSLRLKLQEQLRLYYCNPDLLAELYGSFASGLSTVSSDVDLTLTHLGDITQSISILAAALRSIGYQDVISVTKTRIPTVSFVDPQYDIMCNVTMNQPLMVFASTLIGNYRMLDFRFSTLWISIRQLAKVYSVLSDQPGYISTFGLSLMLIVFLQDVADPPILPRLQRQDTQQPKERSDQWVNCAFDRDLSKYEEFGNENVQTMGEILVAFCYYFGFHFDYENQKVDTALGRITPATFPSPTSVKKNNARGRPMEGFWTMNIADPFIAGKNVAKDCRHADEIQRGFQRMYDDLMESHLSTTF
ncbi:Zinc finger, CCHC domain-containing protein [Linnemannia exigua]|uniref:Zinc finger, CCHC domain-containing protein n=1 Tax=Linnemannia exigua TaxID=604196 RepID=A0AAD4DEW5_9FUNG|nr:Zinc finger, CCHC domain-containing protein [Linnemannia exigua]